MEKNIKQTANVTNDPFAFLDKYIRPLDDNANPELLFAIVGLLNRGDTKNLRAATELAYECADNMLEARKPKDEAGIASVKRMRKTK